MARMKVEEMMEKKVTQLRDAEKEKITQTTGEENRRWIQE